MRAIALTAYISTVIISPTIQYWQIAQARPEITGRNTMVKSGKNNQQKMPDLRRPTAPGKDITPITAAAGNDDVMSQPLPIQQPEPQPQQQYQSMPGVNEVKGKWKQHVGSAKIAWGKLTENELLETEGHAQKLAGLVQERYALSLDEADKQVKKFIEQHNI